LYFVAPAVAGVVLLGTEPWRALLSAIAGGW
jgi:hypothetical protein